MRPRALCALLLLASASSARGDFNATLTTHDLGSVLTSNGITTPGPELDVLYAGNNNSTPVVGVAIFSIAGVPPVLSAQAQFLGPQSAPVPGDIELFSFQVSGAPGPIGPDNFTDPTLSPAGFLAPDGTLDLTNTLNSAVLAGDSALGLLIEEVLPNAPFAFTQGAQVAVTTASPFVVPDPLGGRIVPEPASIALVLLGGAFVGIKRRIALLGQMRA